MGGDIVEQSKEFDKQLEDVDVPKTIQKLVKYARHSRRNQILLAMSIVLDLALSLAVVRIAFDARDAATEASSARTTAYNNCLSSNEARAATNAKFAQLNGLFDQSIEENKRKRPNEPISPEIQKAYDEFKKPVALADCERIKPKRP